MAVVCNPMRMGRWSELIVVCVCHSDEVMVSSSRWESFFDVVDSGLRVKLTELWIKKTISLHLGLGVDTVILGCSSGCWAFSIVP